MLFCEYTHRRHETNKTINDIQSFVRFAVPPRRPFCDCCIQRRHKQWPACCPTMYSMRAAIIARGFAFSNGRLPLVCWTITENNGTYFLTREKHNKQHICLPVNYFETMTAMSKTKAGKSPMLFQLPTTTTTAHPNFTSRSAARAFAFPRRLCHIFRWRTANAQVWHASTLPAQDARNGMVVFIFARFHF